MNRRYRDIGLAPPVHGFVDSPFAAVIASGIAVGVRWLQRHPETHVPLFGRILDDRALRSAVHEAVVEVCARFEYPPAAAPIEAAIAAVTATRPQVLAAFARGDARETESVESAPDLTAREGVVHFRLLKEPLVRVRDQVIERQVDLTTLPPVFDVLGLETYEELFACCVRDRAPTFLTRVLSAWWATQRMISPDRNALAFVSFFRRRLFDIDFRGTRDIELAMTAAMICTHADFWIASDWGTYAFDDNRRLHRIGAPAVQWRDGAGLAFLHGVRVSRAICEGRFDVTDILHARNAEVRRTMIELYERGDRGRFLRDVNADVIAIDYDSLGFQRRLLRVDFDGDEPYVGVEVTNSTPEPDGSRKHYILRVPPGTQTCRAAVAWTFGLAERDYNPDAET